MSVQLLDNIRKINRLLQSAANPDKVVFNDICRVTGSILKSDALVISLKGKLLGLYSAPEIEPISGLLTDRVGERIDSDLNERFLNILSTKENINLETLGFTEHVNDYVGIACPINIAGERLGTLFLYRPGTFYSIDDIILCEYGTTVVGLEIMRSETEESREAVRSRQIVEAALTSLSVSERKAIECVLEELSGEEGILIASRIADRYGITRSVIVNAIRKLESAGVIESKSSGMKGTFLKITNPNLREAVAGTSGED